MPPFMLPQAFGVRAAGGMMMVVMTRMPAFMALPHPPRLAMNMPTVALAIVMPVYMVPSSVMPVLVMPSAMRFCATCDGTRTGPCCSREGHNGHKFF